MKLHQGIYLIFSVALAACMGMIIGSLSYRVAIDGNTSLTATITNDMIWLGMSCVGGILGLFGLNRLGPSSSTSIPPEPTTSPPVPPAPPPPPAT